MVARTATTDLYAAAAPRRRGPRGRGHRLRRRRGFDAPRGLRRADGREGRGERLLAIRRVGGAALGGGRRGRGGACNVMRV